MKNLFCIFTCDEYHSKQSKALISVCDSMEAVQIVCQNLDRKLSLGLSSFDLEMISRQRQTQGLDTNIIVEAKSLNTIDM